MRRYYVFLSRDVLCNNKHVLTYRKIEQPGWFRSLFGRPAKSKIVKFVGRDHSWKTYPEGEKCSSELVDMLNIQDGRRGCNRVWTF